jgi:hypothetical protein
MDYDVTPVLLNFADEKAFLKNSSTAKASKAAKAEERKRIAAWKAYFKNIKAN